MGNKIKSILIAIANATPLNPHQDANKTPNTTQLNEQRTTNSNSVSIRPMPLSNCPVIVTLTLSTVYVNNQRTRLESGTAEEPAQKRIKGFAKRASTAARGTPKAT